MNGEDAGVVQQPDGSRKQAFIPLPVRAFPYQPLQETIFLVSALAQGQSRLVNPVPDAVSQLVRGRVGKGQRQDPVDCQGFQPGVTPQQQAQVQVGVV